MAHFKVSGQIISELSEKIPTNIVALNELIKNSFDANAENVIINFDSTNKFISIVDDGDGMNKSDIDVLLHISTSNKKYASVNENGRYVQGSKGLGVLSVFKFGEYVTWTTKKDKGHKFFIDYNELIKSDDINSYEIKIDEIELDSASTGTTIEIKMRDDEVFLLQKYFSEEKNISKIVNSFNIDKFNITLIIDGQEHISKKFDLLKIESDRQLYHVTYNSKNEKILFNNNNYPAFEIDFPFVSKDYVIDLDIVIFQFLTGGKKRASETTSFLFENDNDELTPLIYVNTNLFNNYNIFNPNVMRSIKTTSVLNQMIGSINIYSSNPMMNFNSDRTQFIQNKLTNEIIEFLKKINMEIQLKGSQNKDHLINFDILNKSIQLYDNEEDLKKLDIIKLKANIKDSFSFKNDVKIDIDYSNNIINYSIFGKNIGLKLIKKAVKPNLPLPSKIILKNKNLILQINSNQINLRDNISQVTDSTGSTVDKGKVNIKCEYGNCVNGILESPKNPYNEMVTYEYADSTTGITRETLTINFVNNNPGFTYVNNDTEIIPNPIKNGYCLDSDNSFKDVVAQINCLTPAIDYLALIACSIRSIFELGADDLRASGKYIGKIDFNPDLSIRIYNIIAYAQKENSLLTQIDKNTNLGFHNFQDNIYKPDEYKNIIMKAHTGAHKSTKYLTLDNINDLGNKVSYFIILINEMLKYK